MASSVCAAEVSSDEELSDISERFLKTPNWGLTSSKAQLQRVEKGGQRFSFFMCGVEDF